MRDENDVQMSKILLGSLGIERPLSFSSGFLHPRSQKWSRLSVGTLEASSRETKQKKKDGKSLLMTNALSHFCTSGLLRQDKECLPGRRRINSVISRNFLWQHQHILLEQILSERQCGAMDQPYDVIGEVMILAFTSPVSLYVFCQKDILKTVPLPFLVWGKKLKKAID